MAYAPLTRVQQKSSTQSTINLAWLSKVDAMETKPELARKKADQNTCDNCLWGKFYFHLKTCPGFGAIEL